MGSYRQWQISQSDCEISCNCGKNMFYLLDFSDFVLLGLDTSTDLFILLVKTSEVEDPISSVSSFDFVPYLVNKPLQAAGMSADNVRG